MGTGSRLLEKKALVRQVYSAAGCLRRCGVLCYGFYKA
jgi:hypothetical protein